MSILERTALNDPSSLVRMNATGLMWQHGSSTCMPTIRKIASCDPDPGTRLVAVSAIGKFGAKEDCNLLSRIAQEDRGVDEQDRTVALEAAAAIQEIMQRDS